MTQTTPQQVSIPDLIAELPGPFQQRQVALVNDAVVRVAQVHGEFPWHYHDEDEMFLCWDGTVRIELWEQPSIQLGPGDTFVIPRGVRHRPVADEVAHVLLIERPETKQYGN
ncbi:cupin domain-containing protein [Nocardia sp. NPDC052566]|uniref:cupin domain-containing protein n=1 Tax=Nocardia sp. NPDC052566 TaxID=3364330 RepID=UPI0037CA55AD